LGFGGLSPKIWDINFWTPPKARKGYPRGIFQKETPPKKGKKTPFGPKKRSPKKANFTGGNPLKNPQKAPLNQTRALVKKAPPWGKQSPATFLGKNFLSPLHLLGGH